MNRYRRVVRFLGIPFVNLIQQVGCRASRWCGESERWASTDFGPPKVGFKPPKPPRKDILNNKSAPASRTLVGAVLQNACNMSSASEGGSASKIEMGRSQRPPSSNQVRRRAP